MPDARTAQRKRRHGGTSSSSNVMSGVSNSRSSRSTTERDGTPAARFDAIQCSRSAGAVITVPEPISPLGGTPRRTMNARLPGSIARKRPHDHSVSKWPRRASVRMSSASDGQFQSFGLKAKRCVVIVDGAG